MLLFFCYKRMVKWALQPPSSRGKLEEILGISAVFAPVVAKKEKFAQKHGCD